MTITAEAARKLALQQAEKEVAKVYTYIKEAAAKGHGGIRLGGPFWTGGDSNPPEVLWVVACDLLRKQGFKVKSLRSLHRTEDTGTQISW